MSQTAPDAVDLQYAIERFSVDAQRWEDNAAGLQLASTSAANITLSPLNFGPAMWLGIPDVYEQVHQMIIDRLREGGEQFASIAGKLIQARDTYQREEEKNVHQVKGIW